MGEDAVNTVELDLGRPISAQSSYKVLYKNGTIFVVDIIF